MENNKKIKIILIVSWIILAAFGLFLILRNNKPKILEDERLDPITTLQDGTNYNFIVQANPKTEYTPLFICKSDIVPSYLEDLALKIDAGLTKIEGPNFVTWQDQDDQDVLVYNIDTAILHLYLDNYSDQIAFTSVERFLSNYIKQDIEYYNIEEDIEGNQEIYTANRAIDENELVTGFGYSDFFYVIDGYLNSARILLAEINEINYVAPLLSNKEILKQYINDPVFPKNIIINTSRIIKANPETYEDLAEYTFDYNSCLINSIEPKLYYSSCNSNYIYYVYKVEGVCDINYQDSLYSTPFQGFINAVDPEYVKSVE
jgi:hypothetical protein